MGGVYKKQGCKRNHHNNFDNSSKDREERWFNLESADQFRGKERVLQTILTLTLQLMRFVECKYLVLMALYSLCLGKCLMLYCLSD